MRRLSICLLLCCLFLLARTNISYAASASTNEENGLVCTAALMSLAAYNDQYGKVAAEVLTNHHWRINFRERHQNSTLAKYLTAYSPDFVADQDAYCIAVAGTSDRYDVVSDLRMKLIPFTAGGSENGPLVHKGFDEYVQTLLRSKDGTATIDENLLRELRQNPRAHLYLTGHSLGGAVATLIAARFIEQGVNPHQITVITFGAPAVGNEKFAKTWGSKINLTRVVMGGDPVRNLIQIVNRRYELFGKKIRYTPLPSYDNKIRHEILLYADAAIRHYYMGHPTIENIVPDAAHGNVYFAKPVLQLPPDNKISDAEAACISYALKDNLSQYIKKAYWSSSPNMPFNAFGSCRYFVTTQITISRMKYVADSFYVSLNYTIFDTKTRSLVAGFSTASDTQALTPVEATLYNALELRPQLLKALHD